MSESNLNLESFDNCKVCGSKTFLDPVVKTFNLRFVLCIECNKFYLLCRKCGEITKIELQFPNSYVLCEKCSKEFKDKNEAKTFFKSLGVNFTGYNPNFITKLNGIYQITQFTN
jgi:formate dehydrogenase maturation protein FdhE